MVRGSDRIWEKVKSKRAQLQGREVGRQDEGKKAPTWDRKVKQKEVEPEEWKEFPYRRAWTMEHGFFKPTPSRLGLISHMSLRSLFPTVKGK